jgi:hypothetical protein
VFCWVKSIPVLARSAILCASVVIGLVLCQVAYATNESSYKKGFNEAATDWSCLAHPPTQPGADCGYIEFDPGDICYSNNTRDHIDNVTACDDGYIMGFVHWCSSDQNACVNLVKHTGFPEVVRTIH